MNSRGKCLHQARGDQTSGDEGTVVRYRDPIMLRAPLGVTVWLVVSGVLAIGCSGDDSPADANSTSGTGTAATTASGTDDGTSTVGNASESTSANADTTSDPMSSTGQDTTPDPITGMDETTGGSTTGSDCVAPGDALSFAADVYPIIINPICTCHVEGEASGLAMTDAPTAYASLVGVLAVIPQIPFVDPGNHENSYIFHKLAGSWKEVGGAGDQMPLMGEPLGATDLQTIADWIDGCALP